MTSWGSPERSIYGIRVTSPSAISWSSRNPNPRSDPTAAAAVYDRGSTRQPEVQTPRDRKRKWRTKTAARRRCWCSVGCGPCARSAREEIETTRRTGCSVGYCDGSARRRLTTRRPDRGQASSTRPALNRSSSTSSPGKVAPWRWLSRRADS